MFCGILTFIVTFDVYKEPWVFVQKEKPGDTDRETQTDRQTDRQLETKYEHTTRARPWNLQDDALPAGRYDL